MKAHEAEIERAAQVLAHSRHAVAFTGAGHSTPSGIPDFRSPGSGLWEQSDPMAVASLYAFQHDPQAFFDWIRPLAAQMMGAQPNPGHHALAELEDRGVLKAIITQNIDQLHHKAGSRNVLELHGSVRTATCTRCQQKWPSESIFPEWVTSGALPRCRTCGGLLKPDVVLFGETLPLGVLLEAQSLAERCDVMLVAGSSLEVYPAAGLPVRARRCGASVIIVNLEPTALDAEADVLIHGDVAVVLPKIAGRVEELWAPAGVSEAVQR